MSELGKTRSEFYLQRNPPCIHPQNHEEERLQARRRYCEAEAKVRYQSDVISNIEWQLRVATNMLEEKGLLKTYIKALREGTDGRTK